MKIISDHVTIAELTEMAVNLFGNMVKAVVDVEKEVLAVDAELHSDLEALLLEKGSEQKYLWGINVYPELAGDDFIEFDSLINMKPSQNNRSRGIEDEMIRNKIIQIVGKKVKR